ncbi:MAG: NAD(P)/FAD-dependent oxidoreductase [Candidatus Bathyarchaeia archaeon]
MDREIDIAIIGAGPSGSYAAWKLASNGFQPIVIEEHSTPGYPEHCTGHIPTSLLENLFPKPPPSLIQNKFKGMILHLPNNIDLKISFRNLSTCLIDRALFDVWLAREAIKKGAIYHFSSRVRQVLFEDKIVKLKVRNEKYNKNDILRTKILIDGEGSPPRLLEKMGFSETTNLIFINAVQRWFTDIKGIEREFIEVYLANTYAYPFYAWIAPFGKDSAKVGLATAGDPIQKLREFIRNDARISHRFKDAYSSKLVGHKMPLGPPIFKNRHGVIPVGDAAAHVKPITGGGIAFSLLFASLSADSVINSQDRIEDLGRKYSEMAKRYIPYLKLTNSIRNLLYSIEEHKLTSIIKHSWDVNLLPELIEIAYPEACLNHKIFKHLNGSSLRWLLHTISSLAYSTPKPLLELLYSTMACIVHPLSPFKLHP